MNVNWPIRCFVGYVGAIAIAALIGGCEVRARGPPAVGDWPTGSPGGGAAEHRDR